MNPILFDFGFLQIRWYSILILVGIVIGFLLIYNEGKRFNITKDFLFNLCFWAIIAGFIGARIYYVIFNWEYYSASPIDILKIWEGGLAIHGGIIGGFIGILAYTKKYSVNTIKFADMIFPSLLLGQAIGRWGNFFNGEAHGAATTLEKLKSLYIPNFIINGMYIGGIYYEPTFFYESLWNVIGVIVLLIARRNKYLKIGQLTCIYLMWYSFGRFFIEAMRTDSLMIGSFKAAQIISVILFIIGFVWFVIESRKSKFDNLYNEIGNESEIKF